MPASGRLRWAIAALLCLSSTLNYLDRQTLSVLAATIQRELHLTDVQYRYVTSSFLLSYTVMYAVSGRVIDAIGVRKGLMLFVTAWSIVTMLHGLTASLVGLAFFRFLLGATQPANFPAGVRAAAEWFPLRERALAVGVFNSGTAIGGALAAPIVSAIALAFGWRAAFAVNGALGFFWVAIWARFYDRPETHPRLSAGERALILADRGAGSSTARPVPIVKLLSLPETWGCMMPRILLDPVNWQFLTFWIPKVPATGARLQPGGSRQVRMDTLRGAGRWQHCRRGDPAVSHRPWLVHQPRTQDDDVRRIGGHRCLLPAHHACRQRGRSPLSHQRGDVRTRRMGQHHPARRGLPTKCCRQRHGVRRCSGCGNRLLHAARHRLGCSERLVYPAVHRLRVRLPAHLRARLRGWSASSE